MSKQPDTALLAHILDSIRAIESFLAAVDEPEFYASRLLQSAVIRELQVIGEAVKRLSPELRQTHSNVPWSQIARMRDKLIHDYFGVDLQVVWDTVQLSLPELKKVVLLMSESGTGSNGG